MKQGKRREFLQEYYQLITKYRLFIGACGCCDSPWIAEMDDESPNYRTTPRQVIKHLLEEVQEDEK